MAEQIIIFYAEHLTSYGRIKSIDYTPIKYAKKITTINRQSYIINKRTLNS